MTERIESWGHFDDADRAFVLTTPTPPRPWKNILWNRTFNSQPTQAGGGVAYRRDADGHVNLLHWVGMRCIYIVDQDSGEAFNVGYAPLCNDGFEHYECRFGLGQQRIQQTCHGIAAESITIVPHDQTCDLTQLRLTNRADSERRLRVIAFNEVDLNHRDPYFGTHNVFAGKLTDDRRTLGLFNETYLADRLSMAYLAADRPFGHWSTQAADLLGVHGSPGRPLRPTDFVAQSTEVFDPPCLIVAFDLTLPAGGAEVVHMALGCVDQREAFDSAGRDLLSEQAFDAARLEVRRQLNDRYAAVHVSTPDAMFDRFANTWIKHQLAYCADWNRGWGKGFRDGMQDAWGFAPLDPMHVRNMIADALPHQFPDGRTLRKWAPVDAKPYNDGGIWLIFAVDAYLRETGEYGFLDETYRYHESDDRGSVFEHMWRAVTHLIEQRGERGLCLMPFGDWNDQLTGPGREGRGESVWTTLALTAALPVVQYLAERLGHADQSQKCIEWREQLHVSLQANGWNGQWFDRAITDRGRAIGHPDECAGRIFLLPQAWAILADVADDGQRQAIMDACDQHLAVPHGYRLMAPPYRAHDPEVGHLSGAAPGTVENGSNYCHATSFMVAALAHGGRVDQAYDTWRRLLPTNPSHPPSVSGQEPFSMTNTYRSPDAVSGAGRSLFSWRTGTAGWAFRNALEAVMGVRAEHDGLHVRGTLPSNWPQAKLTRRYRGMDIHIQWRRSLQPCLIVEGEKCEAGLVPIRRLRHGAHIICEFVADEQPNATA